MAAIVAHLTEQGYDGWYILEQDTILTGEPSGEGPAEHMMTGPTDRRS